MSAYKPSLLSNNQSAAHLSCLSHIDDPALPRRASGNRPDCATTASGIGSFSLVESDADISSTRVLLAPFSTKDRAGIMRTENLKVLQDQYVRWVNNNVFIGVQVDSLHIPSNTATSTLRFILGSKRGNGKYARMIRAKISGFNDMIPPTRFFDVRDKRREQLTPMFKVTMTYDPAGKSRYEAWRLIGIELNKFRSNLSRFFGCEVSVIHTWENFKKTRSSAYAYPHVNLVVLLHGKKARTFYHNGEWRISCKRDLEKYWHSHIDIKAVSRITPFDEGDHLEDDSEISLSHNLKYITKDLRGSSSGDDYVLLNAILWAMGKRAFSLSGKFQDAFKVVSSRLDIASDNSNIPELKMRDDPDYDVKIRGVGVFPGCIFKCLRKTGGEIPWFCPHRVGAPVAELSENWGIDKGGCYARVWGNTAPDRVFLNVVDNARAAALLESRKRSARRGVVIHPKESIAWRLINRPAWAYDRIALEAAGFTIEEENAKRIAALLEEPLEFAPGIPLTAEGHDEI